MGCLLIRTEACISISVESGERERRWDGMITATEYFAVCMYLLQYILELKVGVRPVTIQVLSYKVRCLTNTQATIRLSFFLNPPSLIYLQVVVVVAPVALGGTRTLRQCF